MFTESPSLEIVKLFNRLGKCTFFVTVPSFVYNVRFFLFSWLVCSWSKIVSDWFHKKQFPSFSPQTPPPFFLPPSFLPRPLPSVDLRHSLFHPRYFESGPINPTTLGTPGFFFNFLLSDYQTLSTVYFILSISRTNLVS